MTPADRQLLLLLLEQGVQIDPTEYDAFLAELRMRRSTEPGEGPQAGLETLAILSLVLSVGLTIAASFFKPKPQTPGSGGLVTRERVGDTVNRPRTFAPRYGFDSIQEQATMGTPIPVVYADRYENENAEAFVDAAAPLLAAAGWHVGTPSPPTGFVGGIRINTPLLFSRVRTIRGGQTLSAIFLLGEGAIDQLDCDCFAVGNTSLQGYRIPILPGLFDIPPSALTRRYSVYFRRYGGRIVGADQIQGKAAAYDRANTENDGAPDVFTVRSAPANAFSAHTCFAQKPSTNSTFGCYNLIPNNMAVRISPRMRPTISLRTEPDGDDGGFRVRVDDDPQALAEFWKSKYFWSGRSGLIGAFNNADAGTIEWDDTTGEITGTANLDESGTYLIYFQSPKSDEQTRIHFDQTNTDGDKEDVDANLKCGDVAGIVSGRQRAADQALVLGETYKVGPAICALVGRSLVRPTANSDPDLLGDAGEPFVSDSDETPGNGRGIYYTFMIIHPGASVNLANSAFTTRDEINQPDRTGDQVDPPEWKRNENMANLSNGEKFKNCTNGFQIFRCALGTVTTPRSTDTIEVGIKSNLGINISGLTNFRDCERINDINDRAGNRLDGDSFGKDEKVNTQNFTSGTITTNEPRWAFFRLWYAYEGATLNPLGDFLFAVRGYSGQAVFNDFRLMFGLSQRYDIMLEPVPGAEARAMASEPVTVLWLDNNGPGGNEVALQTTGNGIGILVAFRGYVLPIAQLAGYMKISSIEPKQDLGYGRADGGSMFDAWAGAAEAFIYPEITTTAEQGPEHEIAYVNCINTGASPTHNYEKLSILGLNIQASAEWSQFSQFSAYLTGGRRIELLIDREDATTTTSATEYGPSNLFPEQLYDLLLNPTFGTGAYVSTAQVKRADFANAARWCQARGYFCDIAITSRTNLRQWAADMAATHLLELTQTDGKFSLQPALVFNAAVPIAALFTAGNIVEGSFAMEFLERDAREPIQVAALWRQERLVSNDISRGFFSQERTVLVREAGTPENAALETIDMSDYCTNVQHAIDAAAYIIRVRRLITHSVRFRCTPDNLVAVLGAGDYIRVAMDTTFYDEFANGVILADGTVVTTRPELMTPGNHACTVWDGSPSPPSDVTITVSGDGTVASPRNVVFVRKTVASQVRTYKIESLSVTQDMEIEIEAVEHPTDASGYSLLAKNFPSPLGVSDAYWTIDQG